MSGNIAEVAAALVAFQAEVSDPNKSKTAKVQPKDKSKPAFTYGYADLADVLEHVRPLLTKNGLCVYQDVVCSGQGVEVATVILHSSGQRLDFGPLRLPAEGEPKNFGSAITYARRFALMAALGIAASGDDDGARAGKGASGGGQGKASAAQIALIKGEAAERAFVNEAQLRTYLQDTYLGKFADELDMDKALGMLNRAQASDLIERLKEETERRAKAAAAGADPATGEVVEPVVDPDADKNFWPDGEEPVVPGMDANAFRASREPTSEATHG